MSLFNSNKQNQHLTTAQTLENQYKNSVSNLLLVVGFTAINIVLLVTNANRYFLFSAYLPYFAADIGMYMCGRYPAEYYYGDEEFVDNTFFVFMVALAVLLVLVYLLCWFMAKKKKVGWLIFSLVFFCLDTVAFIVLNGLSSDGIIDIVFHVWVIVSLAGGIANHKKLKKLPAEMPAPAVYEGENGEEEYVYPDTPILRMADLDVKARVLLEAQAAGHYIVYRRVKKVNELVIDGRVYGEYEALVEMPHNLIAVIDGKTIEAGCGADSKMYINIDGETVANKLRLI